MSRFVILEHTWNGVHYDLMLEHGKILATWRLESLLQSGMQPAVKLSDHRLAYLEYEGEVSGGRGCVRRIEVGIYSVISISDQCWIVELVGQNQGKLILRQQELERWQLEWQVAN